MSMIELMSEKTRKQDCIEKFEKFAFGTALKKGETDTDKEAVLFSNLMSWIRGGAINQRSKALFAEIKDCKQFYSEIFDPKKYKGDSKYMYRGTKLHIKHIENNWSKIELAPSHIKTALKQYLGKSQSQHMVAYQMPYTYKAQSQLQSWTPEIESADGFMQKNTAMFVGCILRTPTTHQFIMNPDVMDNFASNVGFDGEVECVRIVKTAIPTYAYFTNHGLWKAMHSAKNSNSTQGIIELMKKDNKKKPDTWKDTFAGAWRRTDLLADPDK